MSRITIGAGTSTDLVKAGTGQADKIVVVDLSDRPATSKIVRGGFEVPAVTVDRSKFESWADSVRPLPGNQNPRVVGQSLLPGTKVARGTAVDLVLAPPIDIPFDIFPEVHERFRDLTLADPVVAGLLDDPKVREPLLRYDQPEDVPEVERRLLIERLNGANIPIDDAAPDLTFAKAFTSMKTAAAYR